MLGDLDRKFQCELLAFQSRLLQGQIEEIPYPGVGTSQLYALSLSVSPSLFLSSIPPPPPPLPTIPSADGDGQQETHFGGKCEVCFECQLVPWDMVKHLQAKWCPVIALEQDDAVGWDLLSTRRTSRKR
ncbi:unnamed protein product [Pleuronectes platessa]|uniref:Uncharacterized protein n=1 Tax=Pleuronectes platessa TaxID=8262 RepID=A0A9N7UXV0_PLEPL|nr:unnamed protein product [Pleuronectes platessa]